MVYRLNELIGRGNPLRLRVAKEADGGWMPERFTTFWVNIPGGCWGGLDLGGTEAVLSAKRFDLVAIASALPFELPDERL